MTTSQETSLLNEVREKTNALSKQTLWYFRARLQTLVYDLVLGEFIRLSEKEGLKKADLARRLQKPPEQITRWLGAPGNWELDTVSDLLLAMGLELDVAARGFDGAKPSAIVSDTWIVKAKSDKPTLSLVPNTSAGSTPTIAAAVR